MGRKPDAPAQEHEKFIDRFDRKYLTIENVSDAELTNTLIFEFYMRTDEFQALYELYYKIALVKLNPVLMNNKNNNYYRSEFVHLMSFKQFLFKDLDTFEQFGYSTAEIIDFIFNDIEKDRDEKIIKSNEAIENFQNDINNYNKLKSIIHELNEEIKRLTIVKNELLPQPKVEEWEVLEIENEIRDLERDRIKKEFDLKELDEIIQKIPDDYIYIRQDENGYAISEKYSFKPYEEIHFTIKGYSEIKSEKYIFNSNENTQVMPHTDKTEEIKRMRYKYSRPRYIIPSKFEFSISLNILENKKELETQCSEIISELKKHYINDDIVVVDLNDFFGLTHCVRTSTQNLENLDPSTFKPQNAFANYFYCYDMMEAGLKPSQLRKYLRELEHPIKNLKIIVDEDTIKEGNEKIEDLLKDKKFLSFIPTIQDVTNPNLLNIKN